MIRDNKIHVYVAGPYRHPVRWQQELQIRDAEKLGFAVARMGAVPVIPHTMYRHFDGTLVDHYWLDATMSLLARCDALITVNGWEQSEGSCAEVRESRRVKRPVFETAFDLERWLSDGKAVV